MGGGGGRIFYPFSVITTPITLLLPVAIHDEVVEMTNIHTFKTIKVEYIVTRKNSAVQIEPHPVGLRLMFPRRKLLFSSFSCDVHISHQTKYSKYNEVQPRGHEKLWFLQIFDINHRIHSLPGEEALIGGKTDIFPLNVTST